MSPAASRYGTPASVILQIFPALLRLDCKERAIIAVVAVHSAWIVMRKSSSRKGLGLKLLVGLSCAAALVGAGWADHTAARSAGFEAEVLRELNILRSDPDAYSDGVADMQDRFDGKILRGRSDDEIDIMTHEGVAAVKEAVRALRSAPPAPRVQHSELLAVIAGDLVREQSRSGGLGHRSNGRGPTERSLARGGGRYISEIITYGHSDPASVIEQFVVGDGVPGRGHRKTVLARDFLYAGVACGRHPVHRVMCVIMLSQTPEAKAPPPPKRSEAP